MTVPAQPRMTDGVRIYNLFPSLAGTIDRWTAHVPRIAGLGFDWIYVNPFHETGYSGSLYAVKDHYRLNPLFRGDASASDDDLIKGFTAAAAQSGVRIMMDLVINHTARDAGLVSTHPAWFQRDADGNVVSPSANDPADPENVTVWTDLAELDYSERPERAEMVAYFSGVVDHYLALGVRGFRCDAAYKVPADVWGALIESARRTMPDVVFAAENLGAPEELVAAMRPAGFDFLFNSSKWWDFKSDWLLDQYERFRTIAPSIAFPESHDTPRLRDEALSTDPAAIEAEYRFRYAFAACFSGALMMPMGYEYGFGQKLDVVMTRPAHWEKPFFDISSFIADINAMKASIPILNVECAQTAMLQNGAVVGLARGGDGDAEIAITLINADPLRPLVVDDRLFERFARGRLLFDVTPGSDPFAARSLLLEPLTVRVFAEQHGRVALPTGRGAETLPTTRSCVIEAPSPIVDGGRHPVKRIAGDRLDVQADIFREGHDAVSAVVLYRPRGADGWREAPMRLLNNDRWAGQFPLPSAAAYEYTFEAWPDAFATWTHDVRIKRDAGQALGLELIEGRELAESALVRSSGHDRTRLADLLAACASAETEAAQLEIFLSSRMQHAVHAAPDRSLATRYDAVLSVDADRALAQTAAWYEFFPRSAGTFADAERELPRIRDLGFDVVYLPPIHPIGTSFRKGRNNSLTPSATDPGSPWAIGNTSGGHRAIEPSLGTLADFDRFVAAAESCGLEIALDYALQCSPDHPYVREHPEWFLFRPDGSIKYAENPPKKYQDIVNFNWFGPAAPALWNELRDVVEFWIGHGVRIFRVDNPHTKPFAFWEWMIGDIRSRHPGVLFLAEAFTRPKVMQQLAKGGFSQSYTYFTWRNTKAELIEYVTELSTAPLADFYRPNFFANTPDILPPFLQTGGRPAFVIRLYLAATLSSLYGIYSGYEICENAALPGREEYADSEKYQITVRDWDAPGNINTEIRRVNRIRRENRACDDWRNVRFLQADDDDVLFYMKSSGENVLLMAVNLNPQAGHDVRLHLPLRELSIEPGRPLVCEDLLGGDRVEWWSDTVTIWLDPYVNPVAIYRVER